MRLRVAIIAIAALLTGLASSALASPTPVDDPSDSAFEAAVGQARASMMGSPADALAGAQRAEAVADGWPANTKRNTALITAWWLQSEALVRLNRARDARPIAQRALDSFEETAPPTKLQADVLTSVGRIAKQVGDFPQALSTTQQAHAMYHELGETRGEAITLQAIATIYSAARKYDRVIEYFEQASKLYPNDDALNLSAFNNVAIAHKEQGRYEDALASYESAYGIAERMQSPMLEARILNNIANLYLAMKDYAAAEGAVAQAMELYADLGESDWLRFLWGVQAQVAHAEGDLERAQRLFEQTFADTPLGETTPHFSEFHKAAASLYGNLGAWRLAHAHHVAFKRLDDEARDIAASTNMALMNAQFDFTNKELQIEQLERQRLEQNIALSRATARQRLFVALSAIAFLVLVLVGASARAQVLRRARDAEREANTRLTDMNAELTAARANLEEALVRANAAADAKSAFLANMSHELRTPLNAIIGFSDLLKGQSLGHLGADEHSEYVDRIHDSGKNMLDIVVAVLDMAALDKNKCRANADDVPLAYAIEDAIAAQRSIASRRDVRIVLNEDNLDEMIHVEERLLRQALEAVLNNAVCFSPEGDEVTITASTSDEEVYITIADHGSGMDEETLARVFAPFEKASEHLTADHGGVGLGLTLAKAAAEANGGSLSLTSTPGDGTQATFRFPKAAPQAELLNAA